VFEEVKLRDALEGLCKVYGLVLAGEDRSVSLVDGAIV